MSAGKSRTTAFGTWWLFPVYAVAGLGGLSAGVAFGLQVGGGAALAIGAGLCMAAFCTIMVDALADRVEARGRGSADRHRQP